MNQSLTLLSILLLCACSTQKKTSHDIKIGDKWAFEIRSFFQADSILTDALLPILGTEPGAANADSIKRKISSDLVSQFEAQGKDPDEIYISLEANGWRKQRFSRNRYTDIFHYSRDNDTVNIYSSQNPTALLRTFVLVKNECQYEIETNRKKTKTIAGIKCYFVKVEETYGAKSMSNALGNTVYEMYVTDQINIPMWALLNNPCRITGFFPLEAKKYAANSPGNYHLYQLKLP